MISRPQTFPLGLIVLLVLLTFGLQTILDMFPIHGSTNNPDTVEYSLHHFSAINFNENGHPVYSIKGEKMWKFPQASELFAENIHLISYFQMKPDSEVKSRYVRFDQKSGMGYLNGNIFAQRHARKGIQAAEFYASELSVNANTRTLESKAPARLIQADGSKILADRFIYHEPTGHLKISSPASSRVKVIYAPLKHP